MLYKRKVIENLPEGVTYTPPNCPIFVRLSIINDAREYTKEILLDSQAVNVFVQEGINRELPPEAIIEEDKITIGTEIIPITTGEIIRGKIIKTSAGKVLAKVDDYILTDDNSGEKWIHKPDNFAEIFEEVT